MLTLRDLKQLIVDSGIPPESLVAQMDLTIEEVVVALEDLIQEKREKVIEEFFPEFVDDEQESVEED